MYHNFKLTQLFLGKEKTVLEILKWNSIMLNQKLVLFVFKAAIGFVVGC